MVSLPGIPGLSGVSAGSVMGPFMSILGLIVQVVIGLGVFTAIFILMQYKYKVTILQRGGAGRKGKDKVGLIEHSIGRIIKDRAKEYKDKSGVTKWKLLFSKKRIAPPDYSNIYPGRNVFLYQSGPNEFSPIDITINAEGGDFEPIAHDVNFATGLELRDSISEYTKKSAWEQYGSAIMATGTILFCLILVGVTIHFILKSVGPVADNLGLVANAIDGLKTIGGVGPG